VIFPDFPGPGILKKKIQDFPEGVGTLFRVSQVDEHPVNNTEQLQKMASQTKTESVRNTKNTDA